MSALRILAFLALTAGFSSSQTSDCSYSGLLQHLNVTPANDALSIMRPVKNWTSTTYVLLDMFFCGILQVDEKSQTVTSHIWIQMQWTNEYINWNPSDFCGIKMVTVPRSRLWIPNIVIYEDASDTGSIKNSPVATLLPSGFVFTNAQQRLTSTCQLNLFLFPFDIQYCNITFASLDLDVGTIQLGTVNNETTITKMSEEFMVTQGEWELDKMDIIYYTSSKNSGFQSRLLYRVKMIRKPMLYVINFIVPLFYLLVLDLASFFISESRGEKLSFKVTVLLSISVLLLILQDMLPSTENKLPMIASYCVAIFALVGISVLEAMLVCFLTDLDCCGKKAPKSNEAQEEIQLEVDYQSKAAAPEGTDQVKPEKGRLPLDGPNVHELLKLILQDVKAAQQEEKVKDEGKPGFCKRLAAIIDGIFFVLYFLTVVTFLTYMYFEWIRKVF